MEKKPANIGKNISGYLSCLDREDEDKVASEGSTPEQIQAAIRELRERKEKYTGYLEELEKSGETQLLTTYPEARRMHSKDGFDCSYNAQTAVDAGSHLIADTVLTIRLMSGICVSDEAKELLEVSSIEVLADKGYDSNQDILDCLMNGTVANVSIRKKKRNGFSQSNTSGMTLMKKPGNPRNRSVTPNFYFLERINLFLHCMTTF